MPRQKKSKTALTTATLKDGSVRWASEGSHPSQVSGLFKDDPTFEEFCEILRQQHEADYRRENNTIDVRVRKEEEVRRCSSSTPTSSRTPKTRTHSSARK